MATAAASGSDPLGETLLRDGILSREQLTKALAEQKATKHRLGYVLVKLGFVPELEITKVLARQYRMPAVDLSRFDVDPKILKLIPSDMAAKGVVLPLKREGRTLTVAMADPSDLGLLEDLKFITRFDLFPVIAGEYTLRALIEKHYQSNNDQELQTILRDMEAAGEDLEVVEEQEEETVTQAQLEDAPVVKLINGLLIEAVKRGRQRHPHRAVRARDPGALPHRRRAARDHAAAAQDAGGAHVPHQDSLAAQHRRAARAAGRPPQAQDGQPRHRLPRLDTAGALRREDRDANSRQGQPDARPDQVRLRAEGREGPDAGTS